MAKEPTNLCRSGSGQKCKGTFSPGGDARYKSQLIDRVVEGTEIPDAERKAEVKRLRDLGYEDEHIEKHAAGVVSVKRAREILDDRKWTHFLDRKLEKNRAKAAKAEERAKAVAEKKAEAKAEAKKATAAA